MSRLRSNKVVNQAGSGAPELTYGAVVPGTGTISGAGKVSIGGSITAASFHGDGSQLELVSVLTQLLLLIQIVYQSSGNYLLVLLLLEILQQLMPLSVVTGNSKWNHYNY